MDTNILKRGFIFLLGLFTIALGVAISVKAQLGISPISCIPFIYSQKFSLSMGQTTIIFNLLLIVLQVAILRKNYKFTQLIQAPIVFLFGYFTDFTLSLLKDINPENYVLKSFFCLLSCMVIAMGIFLMAKSKITYLPAEGVSSAISQTFKIEFPKCKMGVDISMVSVGIISSLAFWSALHGVREGTIAASILVGFFVRLYMKKITILDSLDIENIPVEEELSGLEE
jgi:uncharacterized membrane protein YczE